ncbi:hypothetical protein CA267_001960 [Alteromonas pelagimontana]|uniref:Uncharacterized protein n=1 Tax=Alteromonas pelagimontana TaxID=1858656 RepID=A0A6M4M9K3_9ALTE|nr:hypothetical protein [Alteromonas pelagimontana]QJR79649.1 hypothetical protein CA267_001960 [Alteromonas pelagimontana]
MDTLQIKRLAESQATALKDTIEALQAQGRDIGVQHTGNNCVFVTGVLGGYDYNDAFFLDTTESIERMSKLNKELRSYIVVPLEHGSSSSSEVANG